MSGHADQGRGGTGTMSLTWWSRLWSGSPGGRAGHWYGRRHPPRRVACPLRVEQLEDRTTPSSLGPGTEHLAGPPESPGAGPGGTPPASSAPAHPGSAPEALGPSACPGGGAPDCSAPSAAQASRAGPTAAVAGPSGGDPRGTPGSAPGAVAAS